MLDDGFYTNLGAFPAVPIKNTGVRFTITRLHTFEQIEKTFFTSLFQQTMSLLLKRMWTTQQPRVSTSTPLFTLKQARH
jgi:hypothetical protein